MKKPILISVVLFVLFAILGIIIFPDFFFPKKLKISIDGKSYTIKAKNKKNLTKFLNQEIDQGSHAKSAGLNGCIPNNKLNLHHNKFSSFPVLGMDKTYIVMFEQLNLHPVGSSDIKNYTPGLLLITEDALENWNKTYNNAKYSEKKLFEIGICDTKITTANIIDGNKQIHFIDSASILYNQVQEYPKPTDPNNFNCQGTHQ